MLKFFKRFFKRKSFIGAPSVIDGLPGFVADLDALIQKPLHFKLRGKICTINPISSLTFYKFSNNVGKAYELHKTKDLTRDDIIKFYFEMLSSVCDDITTEDVEEMNEAQITALIQLILDAVTGRIWGTEKKKTLIPLNS
jgi:hypothetical protein